MKVSSYKKREEGGFSDPVSIIICAKNELKNLKANMPSILSQDYFDFEIVIVDDNSEDGTWGYLQELSSEHKNVSIVLRGDSNLDYMGKKGALMKGVRVAKNDILLLTDADCVATTNQWVTSMVSNFDNDTDVVLGYSPYFKEKGFLNSLIRYETFYTAVQYFSMSIIGLPYMGVGRNLAYRKLMFENSNALDRYRNVQSGDDDLLINEMATSKNVKVEMRQNSWMLSKPQQTLAKYTSQKLRHYSTGQYYKTKFKLVLGLLGGSTFLFLSLILMLLLTDDYWKSVLLLFVARGCLQFVVFKKCAKNLGESDLLLNSSVYDLVLALFTPVLTLIASYSNRNKWLI
ncbi:MAG: glycosyltransferase [Flavobacteriales bacterium]|nr:glycosyltransferase [Flavobacteriales bacterium]